MTAAQEQQKNQFLPLKDGAVFLVQQWVDTPSALVSQIIDVSTSPVIGVGGDKSLVEAVQTQWFAFVKAASGRGVKEYETAVGVSEEFLKAIRGESERGELDLTTNQALADLYRDLYLEDKKTDKPELREMMKKLVKEKVARRCEVAYWASDKAETKQQKKEAIIEVMEEYWREYLDKYTNEQYGYTGKVGKHGLCDVFEAEHNQVMEEMARKDFEYAGAFMAAGANVFIKTIEETQNADLAKRLVNQTLTFFVRSPMVKAMKEREKKGEAAYLSKTIRPLQTAFIYKLIGRSNRQSETGLANWVGWETEEKKPNSKVLREFTSWIASHMEKDPEELILEMIFLQAHRDSLLKRKQDASNSLGLPPDIESLQKHFAGFVASIESSTNVLRSGDAAVILELASAMRSFSPITFAALADATVLGRTTKYLRKGGSDRLAALFAALNISEEERQKITREELFYKVLLMSGQQDLLDDSIGLPADDEITQALSKAFTLIKGYDEEEKPITVNTLERLVIGIGETPGIGFSTPGLDYLFNPDSSLTLAQRRNFFMPYFQGALARIRDSQLNKPQNLKDPQIAETIKNFLAVELLGVGRMLMERKKEAEDIKGTVFGAENFETNPRQQYIGLLIDVLTDNGDTPQFAEEVRRMAKKVVKYCLPYWSIEGQKHFIQEFAGRLKHDRGRLERYQRDGLFYEVFYSLGVREGNLPKVAGEKDRIRPIAKEIKAYLETFLLEYPDWMRPIPPDRLVDALLVDVTFDKKGRVTTKPTKEMSLFGQAMRLRDKLGTKKENYALARRFARKITLEMRDDILVQIPERARDQVMQIQNIIEDEQAQIKEQEKLLKRILRSIAPLLMETPVITFNSQTGILETKGISGQGEIDDLAAKLHDSREDKQLFLEDLLEKLCGEAEGVGKRLAPVKLTQMLTGRGLTEGRSPLINAMAELVKGMTFPVIQEEGEKGETRPSATFPNLTRLSMFGDPFGAALGFASQMAQIALTDRSQAITAITDMLPAVLRAREEDIERGHRLAREIGKTDTIKLGEQLEQAVIAQYQARVAGNTSQQEMVLKAQKALVQAATEQFTLQLRQYEEVEEYLRDLQGERNELWLSQAKAELEMKRAEVIAQINIVNSLISQYYTYIEERAITLGVALLRAWKYSAEYSNLYIQAEEKVADPEGPVTQKIIKAQTAILKQLGIRVPIPLPIISFPSQFQDELPLIEE